MTLLGRLNLAVLGPDDACVSNIVEWPIEFRPRGRRTLDPLRSCVG